MSHQARFDDLLQRLRVLDTRLNQLRTDAEACWKGYEQFGMKEKDGRKVPNCIPRSDAEYQGREVTLNKPMQGDVGKFKVYVKDPESGNVKKVNFGDKSLSIKKNNPDRKASYCARSAGQGSTKDKTSANYWSRKMWNC